MKHNVNELYSIRGVSGVFYPMAAEQARIQGFKIHRCSYVAASTGKFNIYLTFDKKVRKVAYTYGEKVWFGNIEERDAYRAEMNAIRAEQRAENARRKALEEELAKFSLDEIEEMIKNYKKNA